MQTWAGNEIEFLTKILPCRKNKTLIWEKENPGINGKKNQYWKNIDIDYLKHFTGELYQGGNLCYEDQEGNKVARAAVCDVDDPIDPNVFCKELFCIDSTAIPIRSPSGKNWHVWKFYNKAVPVEDAAQWTKDIGHKLKKKYKIDFGKCNPNKNGSDVGINFPFSNHTQIPYDPRGNTYTVGQFKHRLKFNSFAYLAASTNLKSGKNRYDALLYSCSILYQAGKYSDELVDEIVANFGTEFDDEDKIQKIKDGQYKKYELKDETIAEKIEEMIDASPGEFNLNVIDDDVIDDRKTTLIKDTIYIKKSNQFYSIKNNSVYGKDTINIEYAGAVKKQKPVDYWSKDSNRVLVEDFAYRPDRYSAETKVFNYNNKLYINTYKPNDLTAIAGDVNPWINHLEFLFPDDKARTHIEDFITHTIQSPGDKIRHAMFIVSASKQLGKGRFFNMLRKILGVDNTKEITLREAMDKAQDYLDRQLVLIDELKSDAKQEEKERLVNLLKRIISENYQSQRKLYTDEKEVFTTVNIMMFSNDLNALAVDPDDPRYFVYACPADPKPQKYYDELQSYIDNEGPAHVLHYYKNRKISDTFSAKGRAPGTEIKVEMSDANIHPVVKTLFDDFMDRSIPWDKDLVSIEDLKTRYKKIEKIKVSHDNLFNKALEYIKAVKIGQIKIVEWGKERFPTVYAIRNQDKYKAMENSEIAKLYCYRYWYSENRWLERSETVDANNIIKQDETPF